LINVEGSVSQQNPNPPETPFAKGGEKQASIFVLLTEAGCPPSSLMGEGRDGGETTRRVLLLAIEVFPLSRETLKPCNQNQNRRTTHRPLGLY